MLVKMELDSAGTRFIYDFFEQYLKLDEREEELLMEEISQLDNAEEFTKLQNSWEEKGIRRGREEGVEEGIKKVAIAMLREGSSMDFIEKVTHLNKEEIEKLQETLTD